MRDHSPQAQALVVSRVGGPEMCLEPTDTAVKLKSTDNETARAAMTSVLAKPLSL
ncbi:MAG: hypothetical protein OXC63_12830 [Aestuariivita sp.]|nr:hypothetical protein [Aestuariivita sp.]